MFISSATSAVLVALACYFCVKHDPISKAFLIFALISLIPTIVFAAICASRLGNDNYYCDDK